MTFDEFDKIDAFLSFQFKSFLDRIWSDFWAGVFLRNEIEIYMWFFEFWLWRISPIREETVFSDRISHPEWWVDVEIINIVTRYQRILLIIGLQDFWWRITFLFSRRCYKYLSVFSTMKKLIISFNDLLEMSWMSWWSLICWMTISIWEVNDKSILTQFIWSKLFWSLWYNLSYIFLDLHSKTMCVFVLRNLWILTSNINRKITEILNQIGPKNTIEIDWQKKISFIINEIEISLVLMVDDGMCFLKLRHSDKRPIWQIGPKKHYWNWLTENYFFIIN